MNMPKLGILTGVVLIVLGLLGYFTASEEMKHPTAFIPSVVGALITIFSLIAQKPEKLKLGMHGAAGFAALGFLGGLGRVGSKAARGEFSFSGGNLYSFLMLVICALFLFFCVKYFIDVRRKKGQS